ncbi:DUF4232 domain-containing protein [Streptomyces sp. NBC_00102]|uniref:DUF4232 domain-containing protein n=1 Tax=Streptomyces sp. NBC_00102 TaxID=2975652 RepID=UPI002250172A|nr:DUF4232 domain-containing protein [Streptomyces sp. NBC_00102]MCX5398381.1 DUF4232 domain-containing protein [Streptomyces sp. NBC_00102]
MRASAFRTRTAVLTAAATAALALTLTACDGDDSATKSADAASTGTAQSGSATPAASANPAQDADATQDAGATETADTASTGGSGGAASSATPACTTKGLVISAETQDGPPYTHIVLTAKNTSGHSCLMPGFPEIRFLENALGAAPAVAKSKPADAVVLTAGAPAYAVVRLSDGGTDEDVRTAEDFTLTFPGGAGMATVKAPGSGGIAVDPAKWATGYWTPELRNGADEF